MDQTGQQGEFVELGGGKPQQQEFAQEALDAGLNMRPRSAAQIIDLGSEIFLSRLVACIGVCSLLWFPVRVLMPGFVSMTSGAPGTQDPGDIWGMMWYVFGLFAGQQLVNVLCVSAVTVIVYGELVGKPVGAKEALLLTFRRLPGLVSLFLVTILILSVGLGMILMLSLLCPFLLLAGIAYYVFFSWRFSVGASALVLEELSVTQALRRSWALTPGSLLRWMAVMVLTLLLVMGFAGLMQLGDNYELRESLITSLGVSPLLFHAVFVVISCVASGISTAFFSSAMTAYYLDTRVRSEGFDLSMRLERQKAVAGASSAGAR
ncbi:MAG: hypothetical protein ACI9F9_002790 [Candidatus Paceibacteria bacterium]|jgi:hypothetical protein